MRQWILWACAGFLSIGTTNFFLGVVAEKGDAGASISAATLLWLAVGFCGICGLAALFLSGKRLEGVPSPRLGVLVCAAGLSLALGMLLLKLGLAAEPDAKGAIVSVISCNSLLVALFSYLVLGESLARLQIAGMALAVAGIIVMVAIKSNSASFAAVLFGLGAMACFSVTNSLLKFVASHKMDIITGASLLWTTTGSFGVVATCWLLFTGDFGRGLSAPYLYALPLLAGGFLSFGMLCIKSAVKVGPAGPATAITGSNSIYVWLLDVVVLSATMPLHKVIGMFIVVAGVVLLALSRKTAQVHAAEVVVEGGGEEEEQ